MSTFKEMIRKVKSEIREVSPEEANARAGQAVDPRGDRPAPGVARPVQLSG